MTDVLIYADTFRSPELRHEVPLGVPDPFLYAEKDGTKHIVIGAMEIPRLREIGGFELHPGEEFGSDELAARGLSYAEIREQIVVRAVEARGVSAAFVPEAFPLRMADLLRGAGVELTPNRAFFDGRRRAEHVYGDDQARLGGHRPAGARGPICTPPTRRRSTS